MQVKVLATEADDPDPKAGCSSTHLQPQQWPAEEKQEDPWCPLFSQPSQTDELHTQ